MPRVKLFLLAAAHILAAAGVLCILWATRYPVLIQELCSADAAKTYEESNAFANSVANANYHILDEIQYQTLYDTDGKYDPDKIVDVAKYEDTGGITGKDETGLSFRLGSQIPGTNRMVSLCVSGQTEATIISGIRNLNR